MTHSKTGRGRSCLVLGLVVLLHLAAFWLAGRPQPGRLAPRDTVRWIQAIVVPPTPAAARPDATVTRPAALPGRGDRTRTARPPGVPSSAITVPSAQPSNPTPNAPAEKPARAVEAPLDLSPEAIGRALSRGREPVEKNERPAWRSAAPEPFGMPAGPARLSETVGASGSRVTRVESVLGTYCIRTPPPGRPPAPGAGPELALPTNCP